MAINILTTDQLGNLGELISDYNDECATLETLRDLRSDESFTVACDRAPRPFDQNSHGAMVFTRDEVISVVFARACDKARRLENMGVLVRLHMGHPVTQDTTENTPLGLIR